MSEPLHPNGQPMGARSVMSKRLIDDKPLQIVLENPLPEEGEEATRDYEKYPVFVGVYVRSDWHNAEVLKVLDEIEYVMKEKYGEMTYPTKTITDIRTRYTGGEGLIRGNSPQLKRTIAPGVITREEVERFNNQEW